MSMCRVISWVFGKGCLLWPACSLGKTLLSFAMLHFVLQGQTCLLFWVSLDSLLLYSSLLWWKGHHFLVLVLGSVAGLCRTDCLQLIQYQLVEASIWMTDVEWLALGTKQDHSVIFEVVPKYCSLNSFFGFEDYFISSKEFLPIVVDIMVIWIKFTHSRQFMLIPRMSMFILTISCLTTPNFPWFMDLIFQVPI